MKVGILDIGSGNLRSLAKAVERAGEEAGIAARVRIIASAEETAAMERLLLPGVGAFAHAMDGLERQDGLRAALETAVFERKRPFLGVCVGMHLLLERGLEHGDRRGLGWFAGTVGLLRPGDGLRVPHMGWNELRVCGDAPHPVFAPLDATPSPHAYFAHSYHADLTDADCLLAATDYGHPIAAAIGRDNILGVQFHPEKSQRLGLEILAAFLRWQPTDTPPKANALRKKEGGEAPAPSRNRMGGGKHSDSCKEKASLEGQTLQSLQVTPRKRDASFGTPLPEAAAKRAVRPLAPRRQRTLTKKGRRMPAAGAVLLSLQMLPRVRAKRVGGRAKARGGLGGSPPQNRIAPQCTMWVWGVSPHMQEISHKASVGCGEDLSASKKET